MKISFLFFSIFFILGCDGYYSVRRDVEYKEPVAEACIKKTVAQSLAEVKIEESQETNARREIHFTWKDKESRSLRGLLTYSTDRRSLQMEARGITAYGPEIPKRKEFAAKELDQLFDNLKATCKLNVVSVKI